MKANTYIKKPIIFVGTGRSGTTIISELINRHPDLAFPSNYQDKKPHLSSINYLRLLFDNKLWRIHGQKPQLNKVSQINKFTFRPSEAYQMWDYITGDHINFSREFLSDKKLNDEEIKSIRLYFEKMVKYQNKKRLSIKVTGPSRIPFFLQIFPDALIINLKRDTIPTISSFLKVEFWNSRGAKQLWWTGAYNEQEKEWATKNSEDPIAMTAFQLHKIKKVTEMELKNFNPSFIEIDYENFVKDPEEIFKQIINFTELRDINYSEQIKDLNIYNRNKDYSDYFSKDELDKIKKIINVN